MQISGRRRRRPPTSIGTRKLGRLPFYMVSKYRKYVLSFCHKARVWQTNRRTELRSLYRASIAASRVSNRPKVENGNGTIWCGSGMRLSCDYLKAWGAGKGETQNMLFSEAYWILSLFLGHSPGGDTVLLCLIIRRRRAAGWGSAMRLLWGWLGCVGKGKWDQAGKGGKNTVNMINFVLMLILSTQYTTLCPAKGGILFLVITLPNISRFIIFITLSCC